MRDDLIETFLQSQKLRLDSSQETPVDIESDVLFLCVLGDRDAFSVGLQLVLDDLSISVMFYTEGVVQHTCDVIVPVERETPVTAELKLRH